jgi:hypothetical protein
MLGLPSGLFPSGFPTKILYGFLICPMRGAWPAYLILLDSINLVIFGESYKLWSSSSCLPPLFLILQHILGYILPSAWANPNTWVH